MKALFFRPAFQVFLFLFSPFFQARIAKVHIKEPPPLPPDLPVLFVSNHMSWWDGFLLLRLHQKINASSGFYTVMLQRELCHYPWFRLMGCLGIEPGSIRSLRSLLESLRSLRTREKRFSLCFYPQGRIWPAHRRPLGFQTGVESIAHSLAPVLVIPVALRFEALNSCAPHAFVQACPPVFLDKGEPAQGLALRLEQSIGEQLDSLAKELETLGEEAAWRL